ncbi:oxidoreductase [Pseudooceanicola lipolyticus]|uniref:Oxidoreductase n=1 Tax=Pseudooceanicola lipolyticus TaxID=2029104 RepID=A0A2M8J1R9_9RHOB|nr:NADH:flavin oxidoreductase/NADH oxidase [Pseudooceanicola lipolyticus]PJE36721.1 oxidoreductase [Pseudooceanicola lipolyticus]
MSTQMFEPIKLADVQLKNRVVLAPMCQYSATPQGSVTDWHFVHWAQFLLAEAGLLIIEATGVQPQGRITSACVGLYDDENEAALKSVLERVRPFGDAPILLQLSHAGRKAAQPVPGADEKQGEIINDKWLVEGPSPIAFGDGWQVPHEMSEAEIDALVVAFGESAQRAVRAGVQGIEIHAAHGYLLSSFLSPLANRRTDAYGGSSENRRRLPLRVFDAVREACPLGMPVGMRINGTDWSEGGITLEDAIDLARALADRGCDFLDVSTGGNAHARIPVGPGYQLSFADAVRRASGLPTIAVGMIRSPLHAEAIISSGQADMVALGRGFLNNPRWVWHAAESLGVDLEVAQPYAFGATSAYRPTRGR